MDEAKNAIHIDTVKGFVQGDDNTINIIEDKSRQLDWNTRLTIASNLRVESFKLGDAAAAKFPYVVPPIQDTYNETIQALRYASIEKEPVKRGMLILGEANAGKTRLAFETLRQTLPSWQVLRWRPDYTIDHAPPAEFISGKQFVLFIDDLQDYIATQLTVDPRITVLRTLWETFTQFAQRIVIIATCRSEDRLRVQTTLNWLFVQLTHVILPSFNTNAQDSQAAHVIAEFQKKGTIHIKDWDGTLGSLVLGLSTKNSQYLALANAHKPAATVLKAMKLLNSALTMEHTEQRMRAICSGVFGERELHENEKVWREAVEQLTLLQFIIVEDDDPGIALVIRKDTYFDKVITDYPPHNQPKQIERDFTPLQRVFVELKDAEALSNLGIKLALLSRKKEALTAVDHALAFDLESPSMWQSKGMVCSLLGQVEEARAAFNRASKLDNKPKPDQFTEGARKVLLLADEEARRFQHNYIGTEHLLLGLIREKDGIAAKVLSALGVELNKVRAATEFIIGRGDRIIMGEIGLTPRAQKVIGLAADEARRLNHQYVGTEHLLLGIVREGGGIAVGVLESLGANLEKVRRQTLQALGLHDSPLMKRVDFHDWWRAAGRGGTAQQSEAPQLKETLDTTPRFYKFTEQAKKVLLLADEEARRFQHNYIGTEHLLLGLIREKDGIAAKVLSNLGIGLSPARSGVEFIIGRGDRIIVGEIGLTPRAKKVIEFADGEARRLNHQYVRTEHLLLGIVREGEGIAAGVLESLGANLEKVRRQTLQALDSHDTPQKIEEAQQIEEPQLPGLQIEEPQFKVPQLKEALEALESVLLEKEQAIQQQEYELAAQLHEREQELLDRIHALESIEIHLHRKHDNKKLND